MLCILSTVGIVSYTIRLDNIISKDNFALVATLRKFKKEEGRSRFKKGWMARASLRRAFPARLPTSPCFRVKSPSSPGEHQHQHQETSNLILLLALNIHNSSTTLQLQSAFLRKYTSLCLTRACDTPPTRTLSINSKHPPNTNTVVCCE